jgi:hypothetical protein
MTDAEPESGLWTDDDPRSDAESDAEPLITISDEELRGD